MDWFMDFFRGKRKAVEDAEEREAIRANLGPPPLQAQVHILQPATVSVNLYEKYIERMGKGDKPEDIMPFLFKEYRYGTSTDEVDYSIVVNPNLYKHTNWGSTSVFRREETFSTLFSIILGCDNAHDFTTSSVNTNFNSYAERPGVKKAHDWLKTPTEVAKNKKAIFDFIKESNVETVMASCNVLNGGNLLLLAHCICVINMEFFRHRSICEETPNLLLPNANKQVTVKDFCYNSLMEFFKSDDNAKFVAYSITRILGLTEVSAIYLLKLSPDKAISTLNIVREITKVVRSPIRVRVDAVSAYVNHAADVGLLMDLPESMILVEDIVSRMDPAGHGALHGIIRRFIKQPDPPTSYPTISIQAFVQVAAGVFYFSSSQMSTVSDNEFSHDVAVFSGIDINKGIKNGENSNSAVMTAIIDKWMTLYGKDKTTLTPVKAINFKGFIREQTCFKTLGDFLQIIMNSNEEESKVLHTFDKIAGCISSIITKVTIVDAGTSLQQRIFRRVMIPAYVVRARGVTGRKCMKAIFGLPLDSGFGKINNVSKRLKSMSHLELKNKLKSVGIKITKNLRGKRKYLTRKELENKALLFNKLQNTAKRMKIKIMYKSRNGMYKYKTYKRLQKEINSKYKVSRKYKKPFVRNFNFG
jgi:hypothetical protein